MDAVDNRCLYARLPDSLQIGRGKYKIDASFRAALKVQDVLTDILLSDSEKARLCAVILVRPRFLGKIMPYKNCVALLEAYFEKIIPGLRSGKKKETQKIMDFRQDAQYIYSAFRQVYGIDLFGKDKNLHWWVFLALLSGLPDNTRLMQIISIRTRKPPRPTRHNAEERAELMRLKTEYALELTEEERERNLQEGLAKLAVSLEALARQK